MFQYFPSPLVKETLDSISSVETLRCHEGRWGSLPTSEVTFFRTMDEEVILSFWRRDHNCVDSSGECVCWMLTVSPIVTGEGEP
jgi:hypothetical protein